jgi:hypothetical protein
VVGAALAIGTAHILLLVILVDQVAGLGRLVQLKLVEQALLGRGTPAVE